jgi:hypothetical protein
MSSTEKISDARRIGARQGALDQLERWPNLTVERIPSTDHMFRALWLQRHVHESMDRGLDRVLASLALR